MTAETKPGTTGEMRMVRSRGDEFEKSFQRLEKIVRRLEEENLSLDESLKLFEEGVGLSRFCQRKLDEVEKKIELILSDSKGEPSVEPFSDGDSEPDEERGEESDPEELP